MPIQTVIFVDAKIIKTRAVENFMNQPEILTESEMTDKIKEIRKTCKNQAQLGKKLGIGQQETSRILRGKRTVSANVAKRLGYKREVTYIKIEK